MIRIIRDIPEHYQLIDNSQNIMAIGESIGKDLSEYGCLFVNMGIDGEYAEYGRIYGCTSNIPYLHYPIDRVH